jgi:hypothetical protein
VKYLYFLCSEMYFVWVRFRACFGFISQRATLAHVTHLKNVWESGKLEKCLHPQTGKKVWKCHFCNGMWSEWNHTKAVGHVIGGGRDITSCKMIPPKGAKIQCLFQ